MTLTPYQPEEPRRDVVDGWARQIADVAKLADYIAQTDFVPGSYRGQPAAVAAAILAGREIGVGPMTALQHMHVIDGRPAMSAQLMRALVLAAGHTLRVTESTTTRCVLVGARRGGVEQAVTWTMDDAKRANVAGRPSWSRYPRQMLLARATGELCRAIFPDIIGGLAYTFEEADEIDAPDVPAVEAAAPTKTVRRTRKTASKTAMTIPGYKAPPTVTVQTEAPPPPFEDDTPPPDQTGEARSGGGGIEPLTPEQRALLMAEFTRIGRMEPRSLRLRTASGLVGRKLDSMAQLTRQEASTLIDTLTNLASMPNPDEALSILVTAGWDAIDQQPTLPLEEPQ